MGEFFSRALEWVREHKALAIALSAGILLLLYLFKSSQSSAAQAQTAANQAAPGGPSDQILSQEIQAQAALQQEQIVAQAQGVQYGYQAQVDLATIEEQAYASNAQNQAALTLGLAQAGDSTQGILQLLGAQPGVMPTTSTIGNTTSSTATAGATLTGARPGGGNGTNGMGNPVPMIALQRATTPVEAAAARDPFNPIPGGTQLVATPAYASCDPRNVGCVENNQDLNINWTNADLAAQDANNQQQCGANAELSFGEVNFGALMTACGFSDPTVPPHVSPLVSQAAAVLSPSTMASAGGAWFMNAPGADVVSPSGTVAAGGILNSVHNASPVDRASILASYGMVNPAGAQTAIGHMFGTNEPMTHTGVS